MKSDISETQTAEVSYTKSDTHIHTDVTDGSLTYAEVISQAKGHQIQVISITNHDTTRDQDTFTTAAVAAGLGYIRGIEVSAFDSKENVQVHILGYGYTNDALLDSFCAGVNERRQKAGVIMVERLIEAGYAISVDEVMSYARGGGIYKQHIMHALLARGYVQGMFGSFYNETFGKGGIAYCPFDYADACETVSIINEAGGLAVVAHPADYNNWAAIPRLVDAGLAGLELYHPNHAEADVVALTEVACEHKLFTTSGSDFHGMYARRPVPIGFRANLLAPALTDLLANP